MSNVAFWALIAYAGFVLGFLAGWWCVATYGRMAIEELLQRRSGRWEPYGSPTPPPGFLEPDPMGSYPTADEYTALVVRFPHLTPAQRVAVLKRRHQEFPR